MEIYGQTDKGITRSQNQDSYAIVEQDDAAFLVVCDGIGGHQAGDVASRLACDFMVDFFRRQFDMNAVAWYNQAVRKVNTLVYEKANSDPAYLGMGTTLVSAIVLPDIVYLLNVGDSRAYYLTTADRLLQITEDHSLVNELVTEGMDEAKARAMGQHVITRAIGIWPQVEGDIFELTDPWKYLLLCSDGLYNYADDASLVSILTSDQPLPAKIRQMIDKANLSGGYDNITAVAVRRD
jgi:protein phosphatase